VVVAGLGAADWAEAAMVVAAMAEEGWVAAAAVVMEGLVDWVAASWHRKTR
jgi:hypothetical protein